MVMQECGPLIGRKSYASGFKCIMTGESSYSMLFNWCFIFFVNLIVKEKSCMKEGYHNLLVT